MVSYHLFSHSGVGTHNVVSSFLSLYRLAKSPLLEGVCSVSSVPAASALLGSIWLFEGVRGTVVGSILAFQGSSRCWSFCWLDSSVSGFVRVRRHIVLKVRTRFIFFPLDRSWIKHHDLS